MTSSNPAASVREDFPHEVVEIENAFISMRDGCRIAARIWLPAVAQRRPVPAILEYIPYRKRDFMRARDEPIHRYFAGYGYAAVRVDVRGSGDSDGVLLDEYTDQEHHDALQIIDWLSRQPWCDGQVGMMGISWGGFNALQVAALRPPQLKAIITLCSTDDRYADDAHYMGGCLLNENLQWGAILMTHSALPPDPEIVGQRWRAMWQQRIERAVAFPLLWMQHPWRDAYWKRGSVCEDYAAIRCPVYAVGGWADGYTNAVFRLIENLQCPKKALIGPWAHVFPQDGVPGPSIGFLQEALRWWDCWLRGRDTGIMEEPVLRVWLQESVLPQPQYDHRPGRWVAETHWPSMRIEPTCWYLNSSGLSHQPQGTVAATVASPQSTGLAGGEWCAFGSDGEMPLGQRLDDGRSLTLDSQPLDTTLEVLGAAVVELVLSTNAPVALLAVRLNDVAPAGASTRVTYGLLNLCHRDGHELPAPLTPGETYRVRIRLNDAAHAFPVGHRVRLAISTAYWPIAWPPPRAAQVTVLLGESTLSLPLRPPRAGDQSLRPFPPAEAARGPEQKLMRPMPLRRKVELDLPTGEIIYTLDSDAGEFGGHETARLKDIGMVLGYRFMKRHRIADDDPLTAKTEIVQTVKMQRDDWDVRLESRVSLAGGLEDLHFTADIQAFECGRPFRVRNWDEVVPRRLL